MNPEKPDVPGSAELPQNWYFSFGSGQFHRKLYGERHLMGHYVKIHGTFQSARAIMYQHFRQKWSMQYDQAGIDRCLARYGWTELPLPTETTTASTAPSTAKDQP